MYCGALDVRNPCTKCQNDPIKAPVHVAALMAGRGNAGCGMLILLLGLAVGAIGLIIYLVTGEWPAFMQDRK
jgi:hypothetical protein